MEEIETNPALADRPRGAIPAGILGIGHAMSIEFAAIEWDLRHQTPPEERGMGAGEREAASVSCHAKGQAARSAAAGRQSERGGNDPPILPKPRNAKLLRSRPLPRRKLRLHR